MGKLLLILAFLVSTVSAEEATKVVVDAKIYKINSMKKSSGLKEALAGATLEHTPRLSTEYGKETGLRFDYLDETGAKGAVLEIIILSDETAKTYSIDINLISDDKENISRIDNHPIGKPFIASTVIGDASRVIQIDVSDAKPAMATYILQVSSNLGCDVLTIELNEKGQEKNHHLKFTSKAFAVVALPQGEISYGNVICRIGEEQQEYNILQDKLQPLSITSGKSYYGGRLMFKEIEGATINDIPKAKENCIPFISRARGAKQDNLCDGAGTKSMSQSTKRIEVFMPDVSDEDILAVRKALSVSSDLFEYLPLKIKE